VIERLRAIPWGIAFFLAYAFVILALIGLSLRFVVDMAIATPISFPGLVVMILLAYTIFTVTLVIQRKEAARLYALGLSSLTIPIVPWALIVGYPIVAIFFAALALLLFRGLGRPATRGWLTEP
jgi:hypothetical protein